MTSPSTSGVFEGAASPQRLEHVTTSSQASPIAVVLIYKYFKGILQNINDD